MIRFKRGLAILLSTCMLGGMMPLSASAEETVSENIIQTESTEITENLENAQSENEKSSETESETTTDTEAEDTAIADVQTLIDALPDAGSITEDNVENVTSQLDTIDEAKAELRDADMSQLDLTRYDAAINKVMALMGIKEENDSEIAVQANDSAGKTEQQSTEEEECKHEGIEITFNSNGFGNCPKCNAAVYQPATETTDKYDINDDGTKDTVYEISNAGQLYWFAGLVNGTLDGVEQNTSANAILTANITVNENLLDSLQYDAEGNVSNGSDFITWTPIADWMGNRTTQYSGTFDGNNKTVSGLYFNNGNSIRIGLFGSSEADGNIKNVGVVDSYFKGKDFVGGVCGRNDGTITNCYNAGNLTAIDPSAAIGGICGYNGGTIANCYNTGTVTATGSIASVGGVCGCSIAPISNCYNIGTVTATSSGADISGICGYYFGPVTNCYYLADTEDENGGKTAAQFASGEVAYLLNGSKSEGDMVHFYQIIGKDKAPVMDKSHGVVYFYTDCTDKTCYANSETASGEHDFDENGFCTKDNTHYQPATLNETTGNYEISNAGQLYWFAGLVNGTLDGVEQNTSANAILTANITVNENLLDSLQYDAEGNVSNGSDFITWTPIADWMGNRTTQYSGTFDGNNKTVSGLYFNNGNSIRIGLFGSSEADGNIKNVGVVDSYFKGKDFVGGVCGRNDGTITNCYNAGNLTAIDPSAAIGGICGYNGGTIANCYNTGTVTATGSIASVGGVCGCSIAPISNCYNIGTVTATSSGADISGICGYYFGPVTNCYYLADTEDENGGKTAAQFASGEIAYLLSQGCTVGADENAVTYSGSVWGQALGGNGDTYPVLDSTKRVYQVDKYDGCEGKPGSSTKVYSNQSTSIYEEHKYEADTTDSTKHKCSICNGTEEHSFAYELVENGNAIKATCSECGATYTVKLTQPAATSDEKIVYDGTEKKAETAIDSGNTGIETIPENAITYATVTNGTPSTYSTTAPKNAGTYKAKLTLGTGDNIVSIEINFTIEISSITDKKTVEIKRGNSVSVDGSNVLIYGEKISKLILGNTVFVEAGTDDVIEGILSWSNPDEIPAAGTTQAGWVFKPADSDHYEELTGTAAITVARATPAVVTAPAVAEREYNPAVALVDSDMTGGSVTGADGNSLAGTWSFTGMNIIPTVNNKGYQAVFTPDDTNNYNTVTRTITVKVTKATPVITQKPTAGALTYGQNLSDSTLTGGKAAYQTADGTEITGTFAWKNSSSKPTAADSQKTEYDVIFTPSDKDNYNTVDTKLALTVNKAAQAPNMPQAAMAPAHSTKKVGDIKLPDGWSWSDNDKDTVLADGVAVTANAFYTGTDKGNYETESVSITITRSKCEHTQTEIRNQREATCTQTGYTGDTYCADCNKLLGTGKELAALGHDYKATVTKQPTTTEEGIMTYTCSRCGDSYTQSIAKLKADDGNEDNGNQNQNPKPGIDNGNDNGTSIKPYIKDDSGKEGWDVIKTQLEKAESGETVTVAMNGTSVVPKTVIDSIKGKDTTLVLDMGNGLSWKINGKDITDAAGDIDFGVTIGADAGKSIPVDVINNVTGERYSMNLSLAYNGEFGFTATLTVNMEPKNSGMYANLFYYNEQTGKLEFVGAGQIDSDGNVELAFTHASDYTIVVAANIMSDNSQADNNADETIPSPKTDDSISKYAWNNTIIIIIGICIILIVFGAVFYVRKKSGSEEE